MSSIINKQKKKGCKICGEKIYANTSWCLNHYKEREKQKKERKKKKPKIVKEINKIKKQKKKTSQQIKKTIHNRVWRLMSEYVRRKGADGFGFNTCYTCSYNTHWKNLQAGHFKHGKLDFDERNLKPQCAQCNGYKSGRLDVYAEHLLRDYGKEWFMKLVQDSWAHQGYSVEEMLEIEKDLKQKLLGLDQMKK